MKKKMYLMISMAFILMFAMGCQSAKTNETAGANQPAIASPTTTEKQAYTKNDIIQIFNSGEGYANCILTDCVVVDDHAYGLIGIVQYTDEETNPCNLAFVNEEKLCHPLGLVADASCGIASDSILTYVGEGKVTLSLAEVKTGKIYDYIVEYSKETDSTHFKISSTERK